MSLYVAATSCAQGEELRFRLLDEGGGPIRVEAVPSGRTVLEGTAGPGPGWALKVGADWPSSLYRAVYHETSAYFVVRSAVPASPILVSIPFPTWEAYNRPGVPGEGLYQSEQPDRAVKVTFDRPGAGPQIEEWELGLLRWLAPAGYTVDYCSGLDLHGDPDRTDPDRSDPGPRGGLGLLSRYRLLVVNGHDEYWSWEMRDAAEEFARRGGNIAIFSGNTCWWQVRFEDGLRTMVCYRDAVADPMAATDPGRVTVEWPSEPVNRPENILTGLSFRNGAGCWVDSRVMAEESYTARFAGHWVFEGAGLADGDTFGRGAIGYETDAADLDWVDGVPRASGRDGAPPSLVVLATADLAHWRRYGRAGAATMSVHRLGAGTVFNAGTINWGNTLHDPALARITRNVLDRLSQPPPGPTWE
ncbi:N,N-dimethylformamidase beta subunit family domain-containing protein, partial [Nonomuraea diastatica]|uniref:N,N-dimethylformamidase beta subunit family domain-containing protein n=1 Tax=Nonomuraea diastatica TaxID=1848329 RepID=UPI00319E9706